MFTLITLINVITPNYTERKEQVFRRARCQVCRQKNAVGKATSVRPNLPVENTAEAAAGGWTHDASVAKAW